MLRGNDHIGDPKQGIRSGRVNPKLLLFSLDRKIHLRAMGTSDPVFLGNLHTLNIIHPVKTVDKLIRILRDFEHPLALDPAHHLRAAPLTMAVNHFLIGQPHLAGGAPVDWHLRLIGQPRLEQF